VAVLTLDPSSNARERRRAGLEPLSQTRDLIGGPDLTQIAGRPDAPKDPARTFLERLI
jgi:hypothetical protein